jgi:hypothetical protein
MCCCRVHRFPVLVAYTHMFVCVCDEDLASQTLSLTRVYSPKLLKKRVIVVKVFSSSHTLISSSAAIIALSMYNTKPLRLQWRRSSTTNHEGTCHGGILVEHMRRRFHNSRWILRCCSLTKFENDVSNETKVTTFQFVKKSATPTYRFDLRNLSQCGS